MDQSITFELPKLLRKHFLRHSFVREIAIKMGMGSVGMPAQEVAEAYAESVLGKETGMVFFPGD